MAEHGVDDAGNNRRHGKVSDEPNLLNDHTGHNCPDRAADHGSEQQKRRTSGRIQCTTTDSPKPVRFLTTKLMLFLLRVSPISRHGDPPASDNESGAHRDSQNVEQQFLHGQPRHSSVRCLFHLPIYSENFSIPSSPKCRRKKRDRDILPRSLSHLTLKIAQWITDRVVGSIRVTTILSRSMMSPTRGLRLSVHSGSS